MWFVAKTSIERMINKKDLIETTSMTGIVAKKTADRKIFPVGTA